MSRGKRKKRRYAVKEITKAGDTFFVRHFVPRREQPGTSTRKKKEKPTAEKVVKQNDKRAVRNLHMLINANFCDGDFHNVLTFSDAPTPEIAKRRFKTFIRKLTELYGERGLPPPRYIVVTEYKNAHIHHHVVMKSYIPMSEVKKLWTHGHVFTRELFGGDYRKLADYLIKETAQTFRDPDAVFRRRWSGSRNLIRPETRRDEMDAEDILTPVVPKGYRLDEETYYEGINPETMQEYCEYVLLPDRPNPKYWKWSRLKKTKPKPTGEMGWISRNAPRQLEFDFESLELSEAPWQNFGRHENDR